MSITSKTRQMIKSIVEIPQKLINLTTNGVTRIFSPSDDDYPKSGVQPYEGDSTKNRD
ncbi:MAG: hypothetical protein HC836_05195 [Richelia sp. RM2_1_2]|nr:hypothetical protein [Richelia sp. SM2_1_7]NJM17602.1 hypothetical protein [Richelia sp. SM1_7_0]NJN07743.1 hypothetical protein [Richelia sp. RM1_1_1]NJO26566.1 hypothetical protein [Richelia sp. SL_2_1]NJO57775.1 hypothetical protein [Richelia sp. RM2_1_2]NJS16144.1 hypothetical protein [Nostocaceae cyanobacterium CSU_2_110]